MKKQLLIFLCLSFILVTFQKNAVAQVDQIGLASGQNLRSSVNYYYAKAGDLTITVNVWGFVQKPGLYEVASTTDLVRLLSLAGGPSNYAKMDEIRIVRISKNESGEQKVELKVNMDDLTKLNNEQLKVNPGDVIFVDHTAWFTVKDMFSVTSGIAVIITAVTALIRVL